MNRTSSNPFVLSASTISNNRVVNSQGQDLGKIHEIMLDLNNGRIAYAVLSFGGFMGMGNKLFAIPWDVLTLDTVDKCFVLDVEKEQLENANGFDKNAWPNFADESFHSKTYAHWGSSAYWH